MLHPQQTINCQGQLLTFQRPLVMGILNLTPDSFYDGGRFHNDRTILKQVRRMISEGADIIDVGGMSSRPGASIISEKLELERVIPVIGKIKTEFPQTIVSIDTLRSKVAEEAVHAGASIVNDISAGRFDSKFYSKVAELGVPYILMHMRGAPSTMQENTQYDNIFREILDFFIQELTTLRQAGVKDIILDVGFGFGKSLGDNYSLLKNLHLFKILDAPILVGLSRKSMIYRLLDISPDEALNPTSVLHMIALQQGAKILRVHDVLEAKQAILLWEQLEKADTL